MHIYEYICSYLYIYIPEAERNEGNAHDEQVEQVKRRAAKRAIMQHEPVSHHFQTDLDGEHRGEEVIEMIQDLKKDNK